MWPRGATETALWGWWLQLSSSLNFPSCRLDNPSHADGTFSNRDVVSPESEALFLIFSCILIKGKPGRVEMKERVLRAWEWHTKRGHANHARVGSVECQSGTTWFQSLCRFVYVWTGILFGVSLLFSILNDLHNSWKGARPFPFTSPADGFSAMISNFCDFGLRKLPMKFLGKRWLERESPFQITHAGHDGFQSSVEGYHLQASRDHKSKIGEGDSEVIYKIKPPFHVRLNNMRSL